MRLKTKKSSSSSSPVCEFDAAYARALRGLRTRDRFRAEVRAELAGTFDAGTIREVLDRLVSRGLVDDARLVRALIEGNRGKKAVAVEILRRRCADRGASEAALAEFEDIDEPSLIALLDRFERTDRGRARAYRYLTSRGFGEDYIATALERFMREASRD